jgi:hypothetical protein
MVMVMAVSRVSSAAEQWTEVKNLPVFLGFWKYTRTAKASPV